MVSQNMKNTWLWEQQRAQNQEERHKSSGKKQRKHYKLLSQERMCVLSRSQKWHRLEKRRVQSNVKPLLQCFSIPNDKCSGETSPLLELRFLARIGPSPETEDKTNFSFSRAFEKFLFWSVFWLTEHLEYLDELWVVLCVHVHLSCSLREFSLC